MFAEDVDFYKKGRADLAQQAIREREEGTGESIRPGVHGSPWVAARGEVAYGRTVHVDEANPPRQRSIETRREASFLNSMHYTGRRPPQSGTGSVHSGNWPAVGSSCPGGSGIPKPAFTGRRDACRNTSKGGTWPFYSPPPHELPPFYTVFIVLSVCCWHRSLRLLLFCVCVSPLGDVPPVCSPFFFERMASYGAAFSPGRLRRRQTHYACVDLKEGGSFGRGRGVAERV